MSLTKSVLEDAEAHENANNLQKAIDGYSNIIFKYVEDKSEDASKIKEQAVYKLGKLYAKNGRAAELSTLVKQIRPFYDSISKAKTAKIVRYLIDVVSDIPNTTQLQIDLCKESIKWSQDTKRTFLRQRIDTRLAELYLESHNYQDALNIVNVLLREVKKLDDKILLVEIHLIESKIHHQLRNIPKAKAALTAARSNSNSIYCPPALQTQLDMQSGVLHTEERDYKTAYSYFYEAFEGLNTMNDAKAVVALKYMLLCKIMLNSAEDVDAIIAGKVALRYAGRDIDGMRAIANAHKHRLLKDFEEAKSKFHKELMEDPLIKSQLSELYSRLLEQNLLRIVEPYSTVHINHVAKLIQLPQDQVERKLSQMILDKKLHGILDQGAGNLIIFDEPPKSQTYQNSLGVIDHMNTIVDTLYEKALKITS